MISLSYCKHTGSDVREINRFVGYCQNTRTDRQEGYFWKTRHCFIGERMRKTENY